MGRPSVLVSLAAFLLIAAAFLYYYTLPPPGRLVVRTIPSGVEVWIDGTLRGATPDTGLVVIFSKKGSYQLVLRRNGYIPDTSGIDLAMDEVVELDVVLKLPGMSFVRGGIFQMGAEEGDYSERPVHSVELNPFYLDLREVSVRDFRQFKPGYAPSYKGDDMPATNISWDEAHAFCERSGKRLPTEAEWERACKGVAGDTYSYGNAYDAGMGRTGLRLDAGPSAGGSYGLGNGGLLDMTGNVWEWCSDWYRRDTYQVDAGPNPGGPRKGVQRVLRGGAWYSNASYARCTHRPGNIGKERDLSFGFRCARDLEQRR
jgi:formylglycine-generating enzyme required for sulfatase activity